VYILIYLFIYYIQNLFYYIYFCYYLFCVIILLFIYSVGAHEVLLVHSALYNLSFIIVILIIIIKPNFTFVL